MNISQEDVNIPWKNIRQLLGSVTYLKRCLFDKGSGFYALYASGRMQSNSWSFTSYLSFSHMQVLLSICEVVME